MHSQMYMPLLRRAPVLCCMLLALVSPTRGKASSNDRYPRIIDDIIDRFISKDSNVLAFSQVDLKVLAGAARDVFLSQSALLELEAPINIVGDIHGQYDDLRRIFKSGHGGSEEVFNPLQTPFLFLGNYVNHGKQSLETIITMLAYKVKYPESFFMLRGNHEDASMTRKYGFYDQCKDRYSIEMWRQFCDVFNTMPVAAIINKKALAMHGGLSPKLTNFDQVKNLPRPTNVPEAGLMCDLLWAEPANDVKFSGWAENDRGVSFIFGQDVVSKFLQKNDMDLVIRSDQVVEGGYEFSSNRRMVTLFSVPNFRGEFNNAGAIMSIDDTFKAHFKVFNPVKGKKDLAFVQTEEFQLSTTTSRRSKLSKLKAALQLQQHTQVGASVHEDELTLVVKLLLSEPKSFTIEHVHPEDTVGSLKQKISEKTGLSLHQLHLFVEHRNVYLGPGADQSHLSAYGIGLGTILVQNMDTWPGKDQAYLHTADTASPDNLDSVDTTTTAVPDLDSVDTATTAVAELDSDQLLSEGPETKFKLALPDDIIPEELVGTEVKAL